MVTTTTPPPVTTPNNETRPSRLSRQSRNPNAASVQKNKGAIYKSLDLKDSAEGVVGDEA
jgi:hypothetical protein